MSLIPLSIDLKSMTKRYLILALILMFYSCFSFKRDLWLNRFDVCCVIKPQLLKEGMAIDFKDGYFHDKHLKIAFDYDVIEGIKIKIYSECLSLSEINWNDAVYTDEYGIKKKIVIKSNLDVNEKNSNITLVSPYNETEIVLIPQDKVYKKNGVWNYILMLDENTYPHKLLGRKASLSFSFPCDEKIYNYTVDFKVLPRYVDNR